MNPATTPTFTGPSLVTDGQILARGVPVSELIGTTSFIDMLFFQLQARSPADTEREMLNAYLVSLCEHGVTSPSTHGSRVAASVRAPFAASAIGFISTAMGMYHFGALERAMEGLLELEARSESPEEFIERHRASGERVWGYGHRFHKSTGEPDPERQIQEDADPRVKSLIAIADACDWPGEHLRRVRAIGKILYQQKRIPINIDGVAAGLLLDMGFEPSAALLFVIIGRLPNIARLHAEELRETPNRFTALATKDDPSFNRTIDREQHTDSDR